MILTEAPPAGVLPLDPQEFHGTRRKLIAALAAAATATCLPAFAVTPDWGKSPVGVSGDFWTQPRWVWLRRAGTNEEIKVIYWANGQLIPEAYRQISWFLRDRRFEAMLSSDSPVIAKAERSGRLSAAQKTPWALMDPVVLDILYCYSAWLAVYGLSRPLMVTSGFRHFISNEMTEGAALAGWHPKAGAVDFFIQGVPVEQTARFGQWLSGGGVGLYPKKNFTHVDRGRVRTWKS